MKFLILCGLLLLASSVTSFAVELQENLSREASCSDADHDHSVLIQNALFVQKHLSEQSTDKDKKVNEEPVGTEPALSSNVPLSGDVTVSGKEPVGTQPALPGNAPLSGDVTVTGVKKPVPVVEKPVPADSSAVSGEDKPGGHLGPSTHHLEGVDHDLIIGTKMFAADVRACASAIDKDNTKDESAFVKAIEKAFACFDTAVGKLAGVAKASSKVTVEFLNSLSPTKAGDTLTDEQKAMITSAEDMAATATGWATAVEEEVMSANASMTCVQVNKAFDSLQRRAVAFTEAMSKLNAHIVIIEKQLAKKDQARADEVFNNLSEAMHVILKHIPRSQTYFKNKIFEIALAYRACAPGDGAPSPNEATNVPLDGAPSPHDTAKVPKDAAPSSHFLGLPVILCVSLLISGVLV